MRPPRGMRYLRVDVSLKKHMDRLVWVLSGIVNAARCVWAGRHEMNQRASSHVNGDRLWRRLMTLARFGATDGGGVSRLALSPEEIAARAELVRWGGAIGL